MTTTTPFGFASAQMLCAEPGHRTPGRRQLRGFPPRRRHGPASVSTSHPERPEGGTASTPGPVSPPGAIGGTLIRAARRSAHLTQLRLARTLKVSTATVRAWENGTIPLFSIPYGQLQGLAAVLNQAGAHVGHELSELLLASQRDLLITSMLHGSENYAEVPPIEQHGSEAERARELIRWALTGVVLDRYRQHAPPSPLLDEADIRLFIAIASDLQAGSHGRDLITYGSVLIALAIL
jgi:DNA-binding transcriptional regulator YiaG